MLRTAGELGRRSICELLVNEGANVNEVTGARKYSLLHNAVAGSNYGFASILLELGANPSPKASNDATPFHFAAREGQGFLAKLLIDHGAKLDVQDSRGRTPLHWAIVKSDLAMIELLIEKGSDTTLMDNCNRSALDLAQQTRSQEVYDLLKRQGVQAPRAIQSSNHKDANSSTNSGLRNR